MPIAYFDCFSGVSGDMVLGALLDAGMPLSHLRAKLKSLPIGAYEINLAKSHHQIRGANIHVKVSASPKQDTYKEIDTMIAKSKLPKQVKEMARAIFLKIARAEARVHRVPVAKVHFHEVGAVDSVVDVVGSAIGFEYFGFDAIHSSPLPMSRGIVECEHGSFPAPAPATIEIIKGIPLEPVPPRGEIITPTGAAILATVVEHFGECPLQKIEKTAYGIGKRIIPGIPNALRLIIGQGFPVVAIECDIDDMNPQIFEHVMEKLFSAGAADVTFSPVQMKKTRPAVRISAIAPWQKKDSVMDVILRETTTFGVRYWPAERKVLTRKLVQKKVKGRKITYKIGIDESGNIVKAMPEYRDMLNLSEKTHRPLIDIYREALIISKEICK